MPTVLKSGNLNLLEPSGPVQACNGIALPFLWMYFSTGKGKSAECHVLSHIPSKLLAMIALGEALPYAGACVIAPSYFMRDGVAVGVWVGGRITKIDFDATK